MSSDNLNLIDFQLYLLKTMLPPERLLAAALSDLGYSVDAMHSRYEEVSRSISIARGSQENIKSMLEEVLIWHAEKSYVYRIPLWPKFNFILSYDATGKFIAKAEFVRDIDYPKSSEVSPWSFLEHEIDEVFSDVREVETWGHYRTYLAQEISSGKKYFLRFAWGLLQEVEVVVDE